MFAQFVAVEWLFFEETEDGDVEHCGATAHGVSFLHGGAGFVCVWAVVWSRVGPRVLTVADRCIEPIHRQSMVPGALCANRSGTRIVKNPRKWCTNLIENTVICLVTRRRDWG